MMVYIDRVTLELFIKRSEYTQAGKVGAVHADEQIKVDSLRKRSENVFHGGQNFKPVGHGVLAHHISGFAAVFECGDERQPAAEGVAVGTDVTEHAHNFRTIELFCDFFE